MLPSFIQNYGIDRLFYFNAASWSIFFEIAVNFLFLGALRHLSLAPLFSLSCMLPCCWRWPATRTAAWTAD